MCLGRDRSSKTYCSIFLSLDSSKRILILQLVQSLSTLVATAVG